MELNSEKAVLLNSSQINHGGQVVFSTRDEKHNHFADFKILTKLGQTVRYSTDSTERVQLVPKFQMGEEVVCSTFHPTPSPADLRKDENNWPNERADVQQFHLLFLKCSSAVWSVQSARIKQIVLEVAFEWVRKGVMTLVTSGLVRSDTYGGRCSATECGARVEKLLPCPPRGGLSSAQYPFSL
jgi:hypothetical protein